MSDPAIVQYPMFENTGLDVDERYKALQQKGLIKIKMPHGEPCWLATRYHDVRTVYGATFNRRESLNRDAPGMFPSYVMRDPHMLVNMDPPEHTRLRRLAAGAFTVARIQQLQNAIQSHADELLNQMEASGKPADFVSMFSRHLPVFVLLDILGIPREVGYEFRDLIDISSNHSLPDEERKDANERTFVFVKQLIAERRQTRKNDLLAELVSATDGSDKFSEEELVNLSFALWHAGFKTTMWQIGSTLFTLMTQRRLWEELKSNPELLQPALVELWRWIPNFQYGRPFPRYANEDTVFSCGTLVRAGEPVLGELSVANRDESVFQKGWEIDFHRDDPLPTLSFAYGAHTCIGHHLARLQVKITVETMLRRFPNLELAVPESSLTWNKHTPLRSIDALPLTW